MASPEKELRVGIGESVSSIVSEKMIFNDAATCNSQNCEIYAARL